MQSKLECVLGLQADNLTFVQQLTFVGFCCAVVQSTTSCCGCFDVSHLVLSAPLNTVVSLVETVQPYAVSGTSLFTVASFGNSFLIPLAVFGSQVGTNFFVHFEAQSCGYVSTFCSISIIKHLNTVVLQAKVLGQTQFNVGITKTNVGTQSQAVSALVFTTIFWSAKT